MASQIEAPNGDIFVGVADIQPLMGGEYFDSWQTWMEAAVLDEGLDWVQAATLALITGFVRKVDHYYEYGKEEYTYGLPTSNFVASNLDYGALEDFLPLDNPVIFSVEDYASTEEVGAWLQLLYSGWWDVNKIEAQLPSEYDIYRLNPSGQYVQYIGYVNPLNFSIKEVVVDPDTVIIRVKKVISFTAEYREAGGDKFNKTVDIDLSDYYKPVGSSTYTIVIYSDGDLNPADKPVDWPQDEYYPPLILGIYNNDNLDFNNPVNITEYNTFLPIALFIKDNVKYFERDDWGRTLRRLVAKLGLNAKELQDAFWDAFQDIPRKGLRLVDYVIGFYKAPVGNNRYNYSTTRYQYYFAESLFNLNTTTSAQLFARYNDWLASCEKWEQYVEDQENEGISPEDIEKTWDYVRCTRGPVWPQNIYTVTESNGVGNKLSFCHAERFISFFSFYDAYQSALNNSVMVEVNNQLEALTADRTLYFKHRIILNYTYGLETQSNGRKVYVLYLLGDVSTLLTINSPYGTLTYSSKGRFPLHYGIVRKLPYKERERIYQESICGIVALVYEQQAPENISSVWKAVILIVVAVVTWGFGAYILAPALQGAFSAATAAGFSAAVSQTIATVIGSIIITIFSTAIQIGLSYAFPNDLEFVALVGFVASVGMGSFNAATGNFGAWSVSEAGSAVFTAGTATDFMMQNLGSFTKLYRDFQSIKELEELEDLTETAKERQERYSRAEYNNESTRIIDPLIHLRHLTGISALETPDEYYAKKYNNTNALTQTIEYPRLQIENSLKLPRSGNAAVERWNRLQHLWYER